MSRGSLAFLKMSRDDTEATEQIPLPVAAACELAAGRFPEGASRDHPHVGDVEIEPRRNRSAERTLDLRPVGLGKITLSEHHEAFGRKPRDGDAEAHGAPRVHTGCLVCDLFDVLRIDVSAADDHQILCAARHVDMTRVVSPAEISGVEEAPRIKEICVQVGPTKVAREKKRRPDQESTRVADWQLRPVRPATMTLQPSTGRPFDR